MNFKNPKKLYLPLNIFRQKTSSDSYMSIPSESIDLGSWIEDRIKTNDISLPESEIQYNNGISLVDNNLQLGGSILNNTLIDLLKNTSFQIKSNNHIYYIDDNGISIGQSDTLGISCASVNLMGSQSNTVTLIEESLNLSKDHCYVIAMNNNLEVVLPPAKNHKGFIYHIRPGRNVLNVKIKTIFLDHLNDEVGGEFVNATNKFNSFISDGIDTWYLIY